MIFLTVKRHFSDFLLRVERLPVSSSQLPKFINVSKTYTRTLQSGSTQFDIDTQVVKYNKPNFNYNTNDFIQIYDANERNSEEGSTEEYIVDESLVKLPPNAESKNIMVVGKVSPALVGDEKLASMNETLIFSDKSEGELIRDLQASASGARVLGWISYAISLAVATAIGFQVKRLLSLQKK